MREAGNHKSYWFHCRVGFSAVLFKAKLRKQGELCDYDFYAQFSGHASFLLVLLSCRLFSVYF